MLPISVLGFFGLFLVFCGVFFFFTSISTFRTEQLSDFLVDEGLRALQLSSLRKESSV